MAWSRRDKNKKMDIAAGMPLSRGLLNTVAPELAPDTLDARFNTKANAASLALKLDKTEAASTYVPGNPTLVVTYNPNGTVATTTENGVLTSFTYNTNGTVNTQTRAGNTKTFTYDANGNVTGAA